MDIEVECFLFTSIVNIITLGIIMVYLWKKFKWENRDQFNDLNYQVGSIKKADQYGNLNMEDGVSNIESLLDKNTTAKQDFL